MMLPGLQVTRGVFDGDMMLTIFTTCKDFSGDVAIHQNNALRSWRKIFPDAEIIIYGSEKGTEEIAKEIGACRIRGLQRGKGGTPYVNQAFLQTQAEAQFDSMCYINADIILTSFFRKAVERVLISRKNQGWPNFLMIGQRWNLNLNQEISFKNPDWEDELIKETRTKGKMHPGSGIDYFFFLRDLFLDIPPFLFARMGWDNYLPWYTLHDRKFPLLDATGFAFVIHSEHGRYRPPDELTWNQNLHYGRLAFCFNANWIVTAERCIKLSPKEIQGRFK